MEAKQVKDLMEAYSSIYAPQEEVEAEQLDEVSERGQDLAWKTGQAADKALSKTTDPKKRAALHGLQAASANRSLGGTYPDTPDMMVGGKPVRKVHDVRRGGTGEGDPDSDRGSGNAANRKMRREETELEEGRWNNPRWNEHKRQVDAADKADRDKGLPQSYTDRRNQRRLAMGPYRPGAPHSERQEAGRQIGRAHV